MPANDAYLERSLGAKKFSGGAFLETVVPLQIILRLREKKKCTLGSFALFEKATNIEGKLVDRAARGSLMAHRFLYYNKLIKDAIKSLMTTTKARFRTGPFTTIVIDQFRG